MTTGRINQVAFLRDAARRTAPDPPGEGAGADAGADVVRANRCLGRTLGEIAPRVHRMDCIREHGASSRASRDGARAPTAVEREDCQRVLRQPRAGIVEWNG